MKPVLVWFCLGETTESDRNRWMIEYLQWNFACTELTFPIVLAVRTLESDLADSYYYKKLAVTAEDSTGVLYLLVIFYR